MVLETTKSTVNSQDQGSDRRHRGARAGNDFSLLTSAGRSWSRARHSSSSPCCESNGSYLVSSDGMMSLRVVQGGAASETLSRGGSAELRYIFGGGRPRLDGKPGSALELSRK